MKSMKRLTGSAVLLVLSMAGGVLLAADASTAKSYAELLFEKRKCLLEITKEALLADDYRKDLRRARSFQDLTKARYMAGQVTSVESMNAEEMLLNCELSLLNAALRRDDARQKLRECFPAEGTAEIGSGPSMDMIEYKAPAGREKHIRCDDGAGTITLETMKEGQVVSATLLFQPVKFDEGALLDKAPKETQSQVERAVRHLRFLERALPLAAKRWGNGGLLVAASKLSFERGLRDSSSVAQAEEELSKAKTQFLDQRFDYVIQIAQLELALGTSLGQEKFYDTAIKDLEGAQLFLKAMPGGGKPGGQ